MTPVNASFLTNCCGLSVQLSDVYVAVYIGTEELYTSLRYKVACSYVTNKVEAIFSDEIP